MVYGIGIVVVIIYLVVNIVYFRMIDYKFIYVFFESDVVINMVFFLLMYSVCERSLKSEY